MSTQKIAATPNSSENQSPSPPANPILSLTHTEIIDVWEQNFEEELYKIMDLIEDYNLVSLDTEFPGVIKSPAFSKDEKEYEYKIIEENVNSMRVIQIGISIANEKGDVPTPCSTWQFNFKYDLNAEPNLSDAIKLLKSSGINFELFRDRGISYSKFSELFISSGIVLNENIKWISFHGGFDFAYLLKLLLNENLPNSLEQFTHLLSIYFPSLYDLKYQIQDFDSIRYDGLSRLGDDIDIRRIGPQHQAGSDSLLTLACFFKLKEAYFRNESSFMIRSHNVLFGLGKGFCENYNYNNHNRPQSLNGSSNSRDYPEYQMVYPGIYNNMMAGNFYNFKEGFANYTHYNYASYMSNNQYSYGTVLQNLVNDLNLQSLQGIYGQNGRNEKKLQNPYSFPSLLPLNPLLEEFLLPSTAKAISASLSSKNNKVLVSGDDKGNIFYWRFDKEKPLLSFNHQATNSNSQIEVTSVIFGFNETEVFSGSNRGVINIWDIPSQKQISTLKGHSVSINALAKFPLEEKNNVLISGSYDSSIKVWDARGKSCVYSFKGHNLPINCLDCSPDGRWIVSGSQDGLVKIWDITTWKMIYTFSLHDAPVTAAKFNPTEYILATGSIDRTVKYWDLEKWELISQTRPEATQIQKLCFSSDGKILFSAAHESLKVWDMTKEALMLDNVESSWRGILDMCVNDVDRTLYGVTSTPVYFGLWAAPLEGMRFDDNSGKMHYEFKKGLSKRTSNLANNLGNNPEKPRNLVGNNVFQQISEAQKILQQKNIDIDLNNVLGGYLGENRGIPENPEAFKTPKKEAPSNEDSPNKKKDEKYLENMNNVIKNNMMNPAKPFQKKRSSQDPDFPLNMPLLPNNPPVINIQNNPPPEKPQDRILPIEETFAPEEEKTPENIDNPPDLDLSPKNLYNMPVAIVPEERKLMKANTELEKPAADLKKIDDDFEKSIVNAQNTTISNDLHFASFIIDKDNNEKYQQFDLINEVSKEHSKFVSVLTTRNNYIKPIVHYLNAGNVKSAIFLLSKLTHYHLVMDALNIMVSFHVITNGNAETASILLQKCVVLIESKYENHILLGIDIAQKILLQFKEEIISLKNPIVMNKVDLAREERVLKYDKLLEFFSEISQLSRVQKILKDGKQTPLSEKARKFKTDLEFVFKRCRPSMN